MPATASDNPLVFWRYWLMLRELPRYPAKIAASRIQERLASQDVTIDLRSVQRDLNKLMAYLPIGHDDNKPRGWFWLKNAARLELPGMDPHTAITFRFVELYLQGQLPRSTLRALEPHFKTAKAVLKGLKKNEGLPAWTEKVRVTPRFQPLLPPKVAPDVLAALYDALLEEKVLSLRYKRRDDGQVTEAEVHPLGLVFRDAIAYLVCTFWEYEDIRLLALHRVEKAALTGVKRRAPRGFDLGRYVEEGALGYLLDEVPIALVLRFSPEAAITVTETPLAQDQVVSLDDDGWTRVQASVPHTRVLEAWLRSFGAGVEVVEPKGLRERFAEEARALAARYAPRSDRAAGVLRRASRRTTTEPG